MSVALQKRTHRRSTNFQKNLPPLPKITGDIILQVFTHKSLQRSHGGTLENNSDNERLSILGKMALDAVVTHSLFTRTPALRAAEICRWKESMLSNENFEEWVTGYNLRSKVRCHPQIYSSLSLPGETKDLFYSYVGGVFAESGMEVVRKWVAELIDHCNEYSTDPLMPEPIMPEPPPPAKKMKSEPLSPPRQAIPLPFAPPAKEALPPPKAVFNLPHPFLPAQPTKESPKSLINLPNPLAPAQPNLPFLPLFNQAASQRGCRIEYPAEFNGPPHAGKWTVRCVVNGIPKGIGTGTSKSVAKEEAARKAYYAMGWT